VGYAIYEINHRDCGYGVPCLCDHPECEKKIDRGLSYLCGESPGDEQFGCGLYFCESHLVGMRKPRGLDRSIWLCGRCYRYLTPYDPKPDIAEWIEWKLTDESWQRWREENAELVEMMRESLNA
jgi:hypothetical protein